MHVRWVCKPAALARSIGTTVTSSPACVAALLLTGPQIVQTYIARPLLYRRRKFDLRLVALLRVRNRVPELFAWKDFWVTPPCGALDGPA
jgi:tubulin--tyrosine ligase-like protein 12